MLTANNTDMIAHTLQLSKEPAVFVQTVRGCNWHFGDTLTFVLRPRDLRGGVHFSS